MTNDDPTFLEQTTKWKVAVERKIDSEIEKHDEDLDAHDELFAQKSTVTFSRTLDEGTKIGSITIDGNSTDLYCETDTDTTYSNATTSKAGLMSASDKSKLDNIATSADNVSMDAILQEGTKLGTIYINGVGTDLYCETNTDTIYTHPTYTARTGKPESNQTPSFGDSVTISQITSDNKGHVTGANDKTIKIPDTDVTTTTHGLMSASDKIKLNGITDSADAVSITRSLTTGTKIATLTINGVNTDLYCETNTDTVYTHPTYTARTGKPTTNQTPSFGSSVTISQITSDGTGHVTGANDKTIKIPDTEATTTTHGLMSATDKGKLNNIDDNIDNKVTYMFMDDELNLYVGNDPVDSVTLSIDKTIIQSGQNVSCIARVYDSNNNTLSGVPIGFYNGTEFLKVVESNNSGISSYTYQGNGSGKKELAAKVGPFVSEPYEVIDALFLDTFTNHNTKWWASQTSASIEATTDGVIFSSENVASTTYSRNLTYITNSFPSGWNDREEVCKYLSLPFCFEFDIVDVLNSDRVIINFTGGAKHIGSISNGDHIKTVFNGSQLIIYKNSEVYDTVAVTFTDNKSWIGFQIFGTYKIKLNNICVYPI